MPSHLKVDYDEVTKAYNENLTSVLRGFRSPVEVLETWVPDEDHGKSILCLVEAAHGAGLESVSVHIGPDTLRALDLTRLADLARRFGETHSEASNEGITLHVSFVAAEIDAITNRPQSKAPESNRTALIGDKGNGQPRSWKAPSLSAAGEREKEPVHDVYVEGLRKAAQLCSHEVHLAHEPELEYLESVRHGITLTALVDSTQHIVKKAAFQGAKSGTDRGVFEVLCEFAEGRPILEWADHGVIYVENKLRDRSQSPPVSGVVTPENASLFFTLPTSLVRDLLAQYRQRTRFETIANFYVPRPGAEWLSLSQGERVKHIEAAINKHPLGADFEVVGIEGLTRVCLKLRDESQQGASAGSRLMQLEAYIHANLEPTLDLEMVPKADQNKIRRIKEVARA